MCLVFWVMKSGHTCSFYSFLAFSSICKAERNLEVRDQTQHVCSWWRVGLSWNPSVTLLRGSSVRRGVHRVTPYFSLCLRHRGKTTRKEATWEARVERRLHPGSVPNSDSAFQSGLHLCVHQQGCINSGYCPSQHNAKFDMWEILESNSHFAGSLDSA